MNAYPNISAIASLIADPSRAVFMEALLDGRALPAGELAYMAGVTPQTASNHLAKLVEGGLLVVERQGRHRYYRLASHDIAFLIETMASIAPLSPYVPSNNPISCNSSVPPAPVTIIWPESWVSPSATPCCRKAISWTMARTRIITFQRKDMNGLSRSESTFRIDPERAEQSHASAWIGANAGSISPACSVINWNGDWRSLDGRAAKQAAVPSK